MAFIVQLLEEEAGKWYSAGRYPFEKLDKAFDYAKTNIKEGRK